VDFVDLWHTVQRNPEFLTNPWTGLCRFCIASHAMAAETMVP
jgi:hypothetical protein